MSLEVIQGKNLIGKRSTSESVEHFQAVDPSTSHVLEPRFHEATANEVQGALQLATHASSVYRQQAPANKANFLDCISANLEAARDAILARAVSETGLGRSRLEGELLRTTAQLRMFAELVREGSWVDARIDQALPDCQPLPKPDLRRMLIPLGPVVVFGASNFPLAFSVAGGDTASALAAGCPVVVKAHPAHPGTSELVARTVLRAVEEASLPEGVFSLLHGANHDVGLRLVQHPATKAVSFTGSFKAGRALFKAATLRPEPIPVYAEMGSVNPTFVLPDALEQRGEEIAVGLAQSVTLGAGQFCTNPGLVVGLESASTKALVGRTAALITDTAPATMLYAGMQQAYQEKVERFGESKGVKVVGRAQQPLNAAQTEAGAIAFSTDVDTFLTTPLLSEEVFGPSTLFVTGRSEKELLKVATHLEGQLTATVHATEADLATHRELLTVLETKVGRLIINGFPTGVEVCPSMHHGGPYPATTDVRSTSVGTAAIQRFVRPICYQNFPQSVLPPELQDGNPRGIWRLVDGELSQT